MAGWIFAIIVLAAAYILLRKRKIDCDQSVDEMRRQVDESNSSSLKWRTSAEQLEAAIDQLRHGVVLLSIDNKFVVLNSAASYLLNMGDNLRWKDQSFIDLIRFPEMNHAITAAKNGADLQKVSVEVPIDEGVRLVKARISRIQTPGFDGLLVSLQDETDALLLDQMRQEFVANTSHELKTPLAAIKGYAETVELAINDDPDAAQHFMRQINVECLRLEHLIEDMMQLARAQSDNHSLTIANIRLRDLIDQSLSSNRPVAQTKSIDLCFEPDGNMFSTIDQTLSSQLNASDLKTEVNETENDGAVPEIDPEMIPETIPEIIPGTASGSSRSLTDATVRADAEAALTIVNNLISNAIRYTPSGGKVTVGIRDAEQFFSVYVHDTGVGISTSDQKRVFERFYRVEGKRQYEGTSQDLGPASDRGTGIGLSIVKQLTKALGGEVRLSSVPGVGSRFEVLLPKA